MFPPFFTFLSLVVVFFFILIQSPCIPAIITTPSKNHNHTWHNFKRFQDAGKGSHVHGMFELKKFFHHFGYFTNKERNFTDKFDDNLEHAVIRYQSKHGLSVTGKLDADTISNVMSPRCGVPDTSTLHVKQNYAYFTGQPRWARRIPMTLTYGFSPENMIKSLSLEVVKGVFRRAFTRWAQVIPVTFVEADDYGFSDIKIGFYIGDHGDGEPFDGVLGILAHAFSPESGKFHLDAAETWAVDFQSEKSPAAVDLESVVTHEIGHVLGLAHSFVKESIMYPSLKPRDKKVDLKIDDIMGIQALYGSNPNFTISELSESDISSNYGVGLRNRISHWNAGSVLILLNIFWLCI